MAWNDLMQGILPGESGGMPQDQMPQDDAMMQLELQRRMKFADALRNQAAPEGQMVSGHYVAPSWTQYLANAVGKYQAGQQEKDVMKQYGEYQKSKSQKYADLLGEADNAKFQQGLAQMPEYAPDLVKSRLANITKQENPMVVPAGSTVFQGGKAVYTAPKEEALKSEYANVQQDPQTGKFFGVNIKTNQVEQIPGAAMSPKPAMTPYEEATLGLRRKELNTKESNNFDSETVDMLADQALAGDKSVFSGRGMTGANIGAIRTRMNQKMRDKGWSGSDIAAKNAEFMGTLAGERAIGTKGANIELAGGEFTNIVPMAKAAGDKVVRSGFLPFGRVEVMFNEQTNDPNMSSFAAYNNGLINTYARAISPTGVPTVSDKQHARELLLTAKNQPAYNATVDAMTREIDAAKRSPRQTRENLRQEISGRGPAPQINAKGWKLHSDAAGNKAYVSPDGKQFEDVK